MEGSCKRIQRKCTQTWGGQFILPCSVTQLMGVTVAEVCGWYFNGSFEDLAVLAAPWHRLCANLHIHFPPVLLAEELYT